MAIVDQVKVEAQASANNVRRPFAGFAVERPKCKVWANWGLMIGGEFAPLPLGTMIDIMEPASTTGSNIEVVNRNRRKNKVLAAFQKIGAAMEQGTTQFVPHVVCQLRRVGDEAEITETEGDLDIDDIVALLTQKAVATEPSGVVEPTKSPVDKAAMQAQLELLQKALNG